MALSEAEVAIEIEDIATWPRSLREIAMASRELLAAYQREIKRIDRLCEDDIPLRVNPPANPHAAAYSAIIAKLDAVLVNCSIVGYHCTRLTRHEILEIRQNGLQILSSELLEDRLTNAYRQGLLTPQQYEYLRTHPQVHSNLANNNGKRTGLIFFCPNRSTLADPPAVYRLFRSWGGEALYCGLDDDPLVSASLRSTGKPCIVKCRFPISEMRPSYPSCAARLASFLVSEDIEFPEPSVCFDLSINRDILAAEVEEVIEEGHDIFARLTRHGSWPGRYQIRTPEIER